MSKKRQDQQRIGVPEELVKNSSDRTAYTINGNNVGGKCNVAFEAIKIFAQNHIDYTPEQFERVVLISESLTDNGVYIECDYMVETEVEKQSAEQ